MDGESRRFLKFMVGSSLAILLILTTLNLAVFGEGKISMLSHENDVHYFSKEFESGEAQIALENYLENHESEFRFARVGIHMQVAGEVYMVGLIEYDLAFYIDGEQVFSQLKPIYGHIYQESLEQVKIQKGEQLSLKGTVGAYFVIDGTIEQVQFCVEFDYNMSFTPFYGELSMVFLITLGEVLLFLTCASLLFLGYKWTQKNKHATRVWTMWIHKPGVIVGNH